MPSLPPHALIQYRVCPVCGKTIGGVEKVFSSEEEVFAWIEDDTDREDFSVASLPCPTCDPPGAIRYATHFALLVNGEVFGEPVEIGSPSVPVIVDRNLPESAEFVVTLSEEEGRQFDVANLSFAKYPLHVFDELIKNYVRDTLHFKKFNEVVRDWDKKRWEKVFHESGIPIPPDGKFKRAAKEHAEKILEWHMKDLIRLVQYTSLSVFGKQGYKRYDPWTVQYFVLHTPLPEDLEHVRTELIARFVSKPSYESEAFFRRLRDLQMRLEQERRKTQELRRRLDEARKRESELEDKLSAAYERLRELENRLAKEKTVQTLPNAETRRSMRYKAIIAEMREEIERLERVLEKTGIKIEPSPKENESSGERMDLSPEKFLDKILGKNILVVGKVKPESSREGIHFLHHSGETREGLEHLVRISDFVVVVVTHISHAAMWYVRELAEDFEKEIIFTRHTNGDLILNDVIQKAVAK
ncbi:MAG: hypothetical protein KM296_00325 [Brockia lithotrophica]|nr:hypothetical protein [Brockia lithotrophica]